MFLPAIEVETGSLIYPRYGIKGRVYSCPKCEEILIFKQGKERSAYFSHKPNFNCSYTERPSESDIHLAAKFLLFNHLRSGESINIIYPTPVCTEGSKCKGYRFSNQIKLKAGETVRMEKKVDNIIPDIDIIDENGAIITIIEIFHTHRQKNRPEPWFEFKALDVINATSTTLQDIRTDRLCNCESSCKGRCFIEVSGNANLYKKNKKSTCDCKLVKCDSCEMQCPQWIKYRSMFEDCKACQSKYNDGFVDTDECLRCENLIPVSEWYDGLCKSCLVIDYHEEKQKKNKKPRITYEKKVYPSKTGTVDFCGSCKKRGKLIQYKNCRHYSCEICYTKKTTPCDFCSKSIR